MYAKPLKLNCHAKEYREHPQQRKAAHVWYKLCAEVLNDKNITISVVVDLMRAYGVSWTGEAFKEIVWKPVLKSQKGLKSTEDQSTTDPDEIMDEIIKLLGEGLEVELPPWPDRYGPSQRG